MNAPARKPALDLTRNHAVIPSGDLVLILTWIFNVDQEDYEPCMAIVPRYRKKGSYKPCCVALSAEENATMKLPMHISENCNDFAKKGRIAFH